MPANFAGDYRTRFEAKAEAIADSLISGRFDFAFLHVKAVDDTGHDRQVWMKVTRSPTALSSHVL